MQNFQYFSPLEQFQIVPIIPISNKFIDISITNQTIMAGIILTISVSYILLILDKKKSFSVIPNRYQILIENIYDLVLSLTNDNIKNAERAKFFPLLFSLFFFILLTNVIGLIPYTFTLTSHLITTFVLSMSIFVGINIICYKRHGLKIFALFLPPGTSLMLAFLLIPIEFISYLFKPINLSIRLFVNMMAGHTLLKVFAGFSATLITCSGILALIHYFPLLVLIPLFGLELGVAVIQAFVFAVLISVYLNDALNLH